jgi:hypothetical protein
MEIASVIEVMCFACPRGKGGKGVNKNRRWSGEPSALPVAYKQAASAEMCFGV